MSRIMSPGKWKAEEHAHLTDDGRYITLFRIYPEEDVTTTIADGVHPKWVDALLALGRLKDAAEGAAVGIMALREISRSRSLHLGSDLPPEQLPDGVAHILGAFAIVLTAGERLAAVLKEMPPLPNLPPKEKQCSDDS